MAMTKKTTTKPSASETTDTNPDPISGEPGAHPVGTGVGAAAAGAAGTVAGTILGGPIGGVAGAAIGAVAGGYAGKAVEESIDPTAEDAYWRQNYKNRPYVDKGASYDTYQPAYQYGWESRSQYGSRRFDEVEPELERGWHARGGKSNLKWAQAKAATRDAWDRLERALPGDADRDGK
jgi:hypothetical protein